MAFQIYVKQLLVQTTEGDDVHYVPFFPLVVHPDDTVAKVKKMIERDPKTAASNKQLIFMATELEDDKTLKDYKLKQNDCILLVLGVEFLKDLYSVGEVTSRLQVGSLKVDKDKGCVVWSDRKKEHYHVYWDNITDPKTPEWRGREQPSLADLKKSLRIYQTNEGKVQQRPVIDENGVEEPELELRTEWYSATVFERPDELFDSLDVTRSGSLSEQDLMAGLQLYRFVGKDEEFHEWFKELDTNGDGRVDKKEFAHFMSYAYNALFDPRNDVKATALEKGGPPMVFLGGSCNPTSWRKTIAIPLLEKQGITYYNPQVEKWNPSLVAEEAKAKESAELLFFVIDQRTLALASMMEVVELISRGRNIVLVLQHLQDGTVLEEKNGLVPPGATATGRVLQDANRARAYVKDIADRSHIKTYTTITKAVCAVVDFFHHQRKTKRVGSPSSGSRDIGDPEVSRIIVSPK